MRRYGIPILIAAAIAVAGCSPNYVSGKTQCSRTKECPSGFSCSDNGTSGTLYCVDNKKIRLGGCPSTSTFYCSQSDTCWAKPGACSTVTYCGTVKHPGSVICAQPNYHPDCNGDSCLPNGTIGDAGPSVGGAIGYGGVTTAKGGAGGTTMVITGSGGRTGTGGTIGYGGSIGTGGIRDAGPEVAPGLGGSYLTGGATARGGTFGGGGYYSSGGTVGRGGTSGSGGIYGTGGIYASGGATGSSLCSGTAYYCSDLATARDCGLANGCMWNATTGTCGGTALGCSSYTSSASCIYNGCTWSGAMTCNATPVTSYCAGLITPSSDACDVCIYGSCCAQLTNCINDEICSTDFSGSLWGAYLDCLINCCGSAAFCNWY